MMRAASTLEAEEGSARTGTGGTGGLGAELVLTCKNFKSRVSSRMTVQRVRLMNGEQIGWVLSGKKKKPHN